VLLALAWLRDQRSSCAQQGVVKTCVGSAVTTEIPSRIPISHRVRLATHGKLCADRDVVEVGQIARVENAD
jgi:hypothetical protein